MARPKRLFYDTVVKLHALHFTDSAIARVVNCAPTSVRRVLDDQGLRERWNRPDDLIASLPDDLRSNLAALRRR